ncbi:MAG TPA: hypothetical protein VN661_07565 [Candidatus Acidoferrales bacterium]|nr:hypothetical protein [Candidatus Acidoferrales bacterium]
MAWAIYGIEDNYYLPGIPALIKLLDFPIPPGVLKTWTHLFGLYPAEEALEEIGKPSLPALLAAIQASPASPIAYANAVNAWMVIDGSRGVAALRRAANAATDPAVKKRLDAVIQAQTARACGTGNLAWSVRCRQSAADGVDR